MLSSRYNDFLEKTRESLKALSRAHRTAFCAACCERLLPLYQRFQDKYSWGDSSVLRRTVDTIWQEIASNTSSASYDFGELLDHCEKVIPDTESFGKKDGSYALNAAAAVCATLECWMTDDIEKAVEVANLLYDTADLRGSSIDSPGYDDKTCIEQEVIWQREALDHLRNTEDLGQFISQQCRSQGRI